MADKFEQGKQYAYGDQDNFHDCVYSDDIGGLLRTTSAGGTQTTTWLRHDGAAWAYTKVVIEEQFINVYPNYVFSFFKTEADAALNRFADCIGTIGFTVAGGKIVRIGVL